MARSKGKDEVSRDTKELFSEEVSAEERAEIIHRARVQMEIDFLKKVLGTWAGRHVLFNIIGKGDIYNLNGRMPFGDEGQRQEGRREMACEVLKEALQADPQVYIMMQREAGEFEDQFALMYKQGEDDEDADGTS